MHVTLTGATGFIGSRLIRLLRDEGHEPTVLSRHAQGPLLWDPQTAPPPLAAFERADAVIHLAGEPVAQRWTAEVKRRIRDSRVIGTKNLVQTLAALTHRPEVLISASAVGYYGSRGDEILTEKSSPGTGLLPKICAEWEAAAEQAATLGIRVIRIRIGVVLGAGGGALKQMLPPFRLGLGGPLAGGQMWMPWIHSDDLCRLLMFCLHNQGVVGAINGVAPNPVKNIEFTKALGVVLHRPTIFPVPEFGLRLLYGEMAEMVLASQRVVPEAALLADFRFLFGSVDKALQSVVR